ncbi:MAG: hypothetical protein FJ011_00605 [Chloroflexi bacterium]|nr:hypothetical protein [Chloroflexota bacterium]
MDERRYRRKTWVLVVLVLLALGYGSLLRYLPTITGSDLADGSIGVLLGLYICSHPAANAVDLLFFGRGALHRLTSGWAGLGWLALNLLALFAGWMIVVIGAVRIAGRAG